MQIAELELKRPEISVLTVTNSIHPYLAVVVYVTTDFMRKIWIRYIVGNVEQTVEHVTLQIPITDYHDGMQTLLYKQEPVYATPEGIVSFQLRPLHESPDLPNVVYATDRLQTTVRRVLQVITCSHLLQPLSNAEIHALNSTSRIVLLASVQNDMQIAKLERMRTRIHVSSATTLTPRKPEVFANVLIDFTWLMQIR